MTEVLGVLGGTFDPIHNGHLQLARTALNELNLTKIMFIPAYIPPHKTDRKISSEFHRLNMVSLAIKKEPLFTVSDIEINMKGNSYTARTLTELKKSHPRIIFIVGADSFLAIDNWYHPEIIFDKAEIACACRDNVEANVLDSKARFYNEKYNGTCHILHMSDIDISSTEIRNSIHAGKDVSEQLPIDVYNYIKDNDLYHEI